MPSKKSPKTPENPYLLPQECSIYTCKVIFEQFNSLLTSGEQVTLDMKGVEKVDACFLQMLHAFNNSAMLKGVDVSLENIPEDLVSLSGRIHIPIPSIQALTKE